VNGAIICGVDASESAKGAARVARALSSELGLSVVFVNAIDAKAADADATAAAERLARVGAAVKGADGGGASRRALMRAGSAAGAGDVVVAHAALPSHASEAETIAEAADPRDVLRAAEDF